MGWLDGVLTFLSLIFVFVVILGLAYLTTKVVASASFKKYKNKNMRLLEGMQIGPQKTLQLVRVGNKILLLAITKDNVVKLETYYPNELNVSENDYDKNILSFQDIFNNMTRGIMNDDANDKKELDDTNENIIMKENNVLENNKDFSFDIKTFVRKNRR